jgi:RND family efflux transporter MFP subunit
MREIKLDTEQAELKLRETRAGLQRVELENEENLIQAEKEFVQAESDYLRKKILYEKASDELKKRKKLFVIKAATLDELKEAERELEKAEIDMKTSLTNYETARKLYGDERRLIQQKNELRITEQKNAVERAQRELEKLNNELQKYIIRTPVSGMVSEVHTGKNHSVTADASGVVNVIGVYRVFVKVNVSESDISKIDKGDEVSIEFDGLANQTFIGKVSTIKPVIDTASRSFPVRISVANHNARIKPGMFARVSMNKLNKVQAVWVPVNVIRKSGASSYVFRVKKKIAVRTTVTTGRQSGDLIEIVSGLSDGDTVVSEGIDRISDLTKLEILR